MSEQERFKLPGGGSIYRERKTWMVHACLNGKQIRKSLATEDPKEAMRRAMKFTESLIERWNEPAQVTADRLLSEVKAAESMSVEERRRERELSLARLADIAGMNGGTLDLAAVSRIVRAAVEGQKPEVVSTPWGSTLEKFLETKTSKKKLAKGTLNQYRKAVADFFESSKLSAIEEATPAHVDAWVTALPSRLEIGDSATWNYRAALSSFFTYVVKVLRLRPDNPVSATEPPAVEQKDPEFLTREQVAQRLERIQGQPWEWVCGISTYCGLRLEDIFKLDKTKNVDIPGRNIHYFCGKLKRWMNTPILDQAVKYLQMMPAEGFSGIGLSAKEVSRQAKAMGIGNQIGRHTLETHLRILGVTPKAIGDLWLAHSEQTGEAHYSGSWKASERPMTLTYHGLPLVKHGIPEVKAVRVAKVKR